MSGRTRFSASSVFHYFLTRHLVPSILLWVVRFSQSSIGFSAFSRSARKKLAGEHFDGPMNLMYGLPLVFVRLLRVSHIFPSANRKRKNIRDSSLSCLSTSDKFFCPSPNYRYFSYRTGCRVGAVRARDYIPSDVLFFHSAKWHTIARCTTCAVDLLFSLFYFCHFFFFFSL